jgi:hypothetical protein
LEVVRGVILRRDVSDDLLRCHDLAHAEVTAGVASAGVCDRQTSEFFAPDFAAEMDARVVTFIGVFGVVLPLLAALYLILSL